MAAPEEHPLSLRIHQSHAKHAKHCTKSRVMNLASLETTGTKADFMVYGDFFFPPTLCMASVD